MAKLLFWLLAPVVGTQLVLAAAAAAISVCLLLLRKREASSHNSNKLAAFAYRLLLAAAYWVPAVHSIGHVCAAMLRCPGLAQLPAALLARPLQPHLALMLVASERWLARGHKEQAVLVGLAPMIASVDLIVAAWEGRFGRWALDGCQSALHLISPQVR